MGHRQRDEPCAMPLCKPRRDRLVDVRGALFADDRPADRAGPRGTAPGHSGDVRRPGTINCNRDVLAGEHAQTDRPKGRDFPQRTMHSGTASPGRLPGLGTPVILDRPNWPRCITRLTWGYCACRRVHLLPALLSARVLGNTRGPVQGPPERVGFGRPIQLIRLHRILHRTRPPICRAGSGRGPVLPHDAHRHGRYRPTRRPPQRPRREEPSPSP